MKPVVFVEVHGELDVDSGARGEGRVLDLVKAELVEAVDEFEGDAVLVLARSGLLVEDFLAFDDAHVVLAEEGRERHFDGLELVGGAGLAVACRPVVAGVDFLFAGDVGLLFRPELLGRPFGAPDDELLALEDGCVAVGHGDDESGDA